MAAIKPTIENVVPLVVYKKTQPRQLNNNNPHNTNIHTTPTMDQAILFGGGRDFILTLLNSRDIPTEQKLDSVDLFILNSCVILWFDVLGHGLQIPYTSILYHAIETNHTRATPTTMEDGHSLALILTLERDPILNEFFPHEQQSALMDNTMIDSVELVLFPKFSMYERHYNTQIETLFTFSNFGMNRGDEMITNCHDALARGMELHLDTFRNDEVSGDPQDVDDGTTASFTGISDFLQNTTFQNSGRADDLDNDETFLHQVVNNNPTEAGMSLQFQVNNKLNGKRRF